MKLVEICALLKTDYFLDVVAIQNGYFCKVYDDDAIWMNKKWGWKIAEHKVRGKVDHIYTGFYSKNKKLYAERFEKLGLSYAIVGIKNYEAGKSKPPFFRYVEYSSDSSLASKEFGKTKRTLKEKLTKDDLKKDAASGHDDFLQGILAGVNITTGEQLSSDSIWSHPAIQEDIRYYLESNTKK